MILRVECRLLIIVKLYRKLYIQNPLPHFSLGFDLTASAMLSPFGWFCIPMDYLIAHHCAMLPCMKSTNAQIWTHGIESDFHMNILFSFHSPPSLSLLANNTTSLHIPTDQSQFNSSVHLWKIRHIHLPKSQALPLRTVKRNGSQHMADNPTHLLNFVMFCRKRSTNLHVLKSLMFVTTDGIVGTRALN